MGKRTKNIITKVDYKRGRIFYDQVTTTKIQGVVIDVEITGGGKIPLPDDSTPKAALRQLVFLELSGELQEKKRLAELRRDERLQEIVDLTDDIANPPAEPDPPTP